MKRNERMEYERRLDQCSRGIGGSSKGVYGGETFAVFDNDVDPSLYFHISYSEMGLHVKTYMPRVVLQLRSEGCKGTAALVQ
jgi:hypothetical protein